MSWVIGYDIESGPGDEEFTEWWIATDGVRSFRSTSEVDAKWLVKMVESAPSDSCHNCRHNTERVADHPCVSCRGVSFLNWEARR